MAFTPADELTINSLKRSDIVATTFGLKPFIDSSCWVGTANQYARDAIKQIEDNPPINVPRKKDLAQYVAASSVLHANDGWSYLGRSVSSLMSGDAHRALHLAYYAELRAAMSLLAGQGVGIFNNRHYVITAPNVTAKLNISKGTHQVVWMVLEQWSRQPVSGALFSRLVRPEGITLDDWFAPVGGVAALAAQAQDWFMQWGMDLHFATNDRQARNESSYRPDGIPISWEIAPTDVLNFVRELWRVLEPGDQSSFDEIDRFILRLTLEKQYAGVSGEAASSGNPRFVNHVNNVVQAQNLAGSAVPRWRDFLLRRSVPVDPPLFVNSTVKPSGAASDPFAVLSRAALLLRLATGSAQDLLSQAGFNAASLTFWSDSIGASRGLWDPSTPPDRLTDLWADIKDTLSDIDDLEISNPTAYSTMHSLRYGPAAQLHMLSSHERVGLWGLCPN